MLYHNELTKAFNTAYNALSLAPRSTQRSLWPPPNHPTDNIEAHKHNTISCELMQGMRLELLYSRAPAKHDQRVTHMMYWVYGPPKIDTDGIWWFWFHQWGKTAFELLAVSSRQLFRTNIAEVSPAQHATTYRQHCPQNTKKQCFQNTIDVKHTVYLIAKPRVEISTNSDCVIDNSSKRSQHYRAHVKNVSKKRHSIYYLWKQLIYSPNRSPHVVLRRV